ncbi:pseudouridine synthase [Candidatus Endolissoclinum faulkneri L5]|uniref:Pseudouridine synthase n=1 Tax=Candidatus Endolissoclinum faulkneri L5 TaxID=1401328 RepID=V9TXE4_9PROT|nr:pseudouridine synthase [Candidatus Endolissoclinum faulkneri]AHC74000.1 pseudouridine synthase [Candidatus Endolissoclinum faulkneri L5]
MKIAGEIVSNQFTSQLNQTEELSRPISILPRTLLDEQNKSERIARRIARSGLCSRREAENWIANGRIKLNGEILNTPAITVTKHSEIMVDDKPLAQIDRTRLWLYHKVPGTITTNCDPQGRRTVFDAMPKDMPRTIAVGRLDINSEGLLILTNNGSLARYLALPSTGLKRTYRARVFGKIDNNALARLKQGICIDGFTYRAFNVNIDRLLNCNSWLTINIKEGKNREIRRVMKHLGLSVNRLLRISYGPFRLGNILPEQTKEIDTKLLNSLLKLKL